MSVLIERLFAIMRPMKVPYIWRNHLRMYITIIFALAFAINFNYHIYRKHVTIGWWIRASGCFFKKIQKKRSKYSQLPSMEIASKGIRISTEWTLLRLFGLVHDDTSLCTIRTVICTPQIITATIGPVLCVLVTSTLLAHQLWMKRRQCERQANEEVTGVRSLHSSSLHSHHIQTCHVPHSMAIRSGERPWQSCALAYVSRARQRPVHSLSCGLDGGTHLVIALTTWLG